MSEKLNFTVDSALLRELGEKLVETVHIALVELVKNSYDADSTEVEILFTKDEFGKSQIQIIDNGKGMNFNSVQKYWMRIATTNKGGNGSSTIFGRPISIRLSYRCNHSCCCFQHTRSAWACSELSAAFGL